MNKFFVSKTQNLLRISYNCIFCCSCFQKVFPVKHSPRGKMYIINNTRFILENHRDRQGSNFDVDNLKQLANKLDMTPEVYTDLKGQVSEADLLLHLLFFTGNCDNKDHSNTKT